MVGGVVTIIMLAIIYAGVAHQINPPSNIETVDPKTLHLTGEFTEANLGTRVDARPGHEPGRRDAIRLPTAVHPRAGEPTGHPALREP